jgi:hypothetical protein
MIAMTSFPPPPPPIHRRSLKQGPLSYSQESLWFLQQLNPENIAYNSAFLYRFTGGISPSFLEQALNELVRRHEPYRTLYPNQGGKPIQVIQPFIPFSLPCVDFSGLAEDERQQAIRRYAFEQGNHVYDLQHGPLVRFALMHSSSNEDYLFFGIHHIGSDGWSQEIFISELIEVYPAFHSGKEPALPELPIQYADYAAWQREWLTGDTLSAYIEHWKNILSGDLPVLELHTDRPRPALQSYRGARVHFQLPERLSFHMKDFCRTKRMTLFQLLLAAYALLLMRHTGQEDIIIGCPFANRDRHELDGLVGMFVNTLPIRINLSGNPSVQEFLKRVQSVMLEAYSWQAAPFEALVSEISPERDLSRTPVFQVLINLRNVPKRKAFVEGLEVESIMREDAPSPFDLSLEFDIGEDGVLDVSFTYNIDLYDENSIIHMAAHYQNLLSELLMKVEHPIAELEMLTAFERNQIVFEWNETGTDFPQGCIHDQFAEQAEKNPAALAVVCNGNSLSYGELEKRANQLAY